jgi:SHS2 domain-containing protein
VRQLPLPTPSLLSPKLLARAPLVSGHDVLSLLYNFLDEFLFVFSTEYFVCKALKVTSFNMTTFKIEAVAEGEIFSLDKHPQGTEIKAITYSNMQVR